MSPKRTTVAALAAAALLAGGCAAMGEGPTGHLADESKAAQIQPGTTTGAQVRQLLGEPASITGGRRWDYWEYRLDDSLRRRALWVGVSSDGVVREVQILGERRMGTT